MRNPKECFCIRQNQTFFILNELRGPECKDGSEPLLFHHGTFSRFVFVIINEQKKAVTANLPVSAIPGIVEKVRNLNFAGMLSQTKEKAHSSAAYTTVITSGILKGKTPAAALTENAQENRTLLIQQAKWLQQNLNRYPRNQVQIQAIEEGLKLYEEEKLDREASAVFRSEIVYQSGMRPLIRRKRGDGKCFVYEMSIKWNGGAEKPVEVEIRNYYAPVEKKDSGLLNVRAKERSDEVKNSFSLTIEQWLWAVHMLEANIREFESLHAAQAYKTAEEDERKNLEEAKKSGKIAS